MREDAVISNVEKVVAERLPVCVTILEVGSTEAVGNSVPPVDRKDWRDKKQA